MLAAPLLLIAVGCDKASQSQHHDHPATVDDGTFYSTPSEFVRDLLRQKQMQHEAAKIRAGILEGYQDAINGRTSVFKGDLPSMLKKAKK